jgi:AcrR family transcriptional regulator
MPARDPTGRHHAQADRDTAPRPSSEQRRAQILNGALWVFSTKGFAEASIKDIAAAAGIGSPGLIYHYFKDKQDVFRQLVEQRIPVFDLLAHGDELMAIPPRHLLTKLASIVLTAAGDPQTAALMKLMLGESLRQPQVAETLNAVGPGRGFRLLREYLARHMDAGRLRRMDPGAAVRCFVGPLVLYVLSREVFVQPDTADLTPEAMVEGAVDLFMRGMAPPASDGASLRSANQ